MRVSIIYTIILLYFLCTPLNAQYVGWDDDFDDGNLNDWMIYCQDRNTGTGEFTIVEDYRVINSEQSLEMDSKGAACECLT